MPTALPRLRPLLLLPLCASLWLASGVAVAEPGTPSETQVRMARELFLQGVRMSGQGDYAAARDLFLRSRALVPRANTLLNLMVVDLKLGKPVEALRLADEVEGMALAEDQRGQLSHLREAAADSIFTLDLRLTPPEAMLSVDEQPAAGAGATRQLRLDPGEHELQIRAEGHHAQRLHLQARAGQREQRRIDLEPRQPSRNEARMALGAPVAPVDEDDTSSVRRKRIRRALWTTAGIVIAAVAVAVPLSLRDPGLQSVDDRALIVPGR